jgi:hypothetical protein
MTVSGNDAVEKEWFPHIDAQQHEIKVSLHRLGGKDTLARLHKAAAQWKRRFAGRRESGSSAPPADVTGETAMESASIVHELQTRTRRAELSNERLAHEVALDQAYRIPEMANGDGDGDGDGDGAHEFWSAAVARVGAGDADVAAGVVVALKAALMACCLGAESVRRDVDARLDETMVAQQVRCAAVALLDTVPWPRRRTQLQGRNAPYLCWQALARMVLQICVCAHADCTGDVLACGPRGVCHPDDAAALFARPRRRREGPGRHARCLGRRRRAAAVAVDSRASGMCRHTGWSQG